MTLFIASLFLPQTLGFVQQEDNAPAVDVSDAGGSAHGKSGLSNIPNLLNTFASRTPSTAPTRRDSPMVLATPPVTPPRSRLISPTDNGMSRQASQDEHLSSLSARLHKVKVDPGAAKPKRNLTIPQSRASSPPAAALVTPRPPFMRSATKTRPAEYVPGEGKKRDHLLLRQTQAFVNPAYSNARYQTFDQDKGNGGLRNAVNAAFTAGRIKKPLWVGLLGREGQRGPLYLAHVLGIPGDEIASATKERIHRDFETRPNIHSLVVDVSDDTARQGYDHYCMCPITSHRSAN